MIVVTLTKVPNSLRGDLTKWYQEIQTGVYVGNVSARVRDALWDRIMENIGRGEATMVYNAQNELGYTFRTTRKDRQVVDFDGIPLMMQLKEAPETIRHGFSNAAKFHRARVMQGRALKKRRVSSNQIEVVSLDLETTGLDSAKDEIISIGAVKFDQVHQKARFYQLVQTKRSVSEKITALTGITNEMLANEGTDLVTALKKLQAFIGTMPVVGYNLAFDEHFLTSGFRKSGLDDLSVKMVDLMPVVKKTNKFLDNYRLETVLDEYGIENAEPHHSLSDAEATFELTCKLKEKGDF